MQWFAVVLTVRTVKGFGVLGSFLCTLALAAPAQARLASTPERIAAFQSVALRYWFPSTPQCGTPQWGLNSEDEWQDGESYFTDCRYYISQRPWQWMYDDPINYAEDACDTVVHEIGHLVLGPTYFADVNPTDPSHSPDYHSIMHSPIYEAGRRSVRECRPAWIRRGRTRQLLVAHVVVAERYLGKRRRGVKRA